VIFISFFQSRLELKKELGGSLGGKMPIVTSNFQSIPSFGFPETCKVATNEKAISPKTFGFSFSGFSFPEPYKEQP